MITESRSGEGRLFFAPELSEGRNMIDEKLLPDILGDIKGALLNFFYSAVAAGRRVGIVAARAAENVELEDGAVGMPMRILTGVSRIIGEAELVNRIVQSIQDQAGDANFVRVVG